MKVSIKFILLVILTLPIGSLYAADIPTLEKRLLEGDVLRQRVEALDTLVAVMPAEQSVRLLHHIEALANAARPESIQKVNSAEVNRLQQGLQILDHFLETCAEKFAEHPANRDELVAMLIRVVNSTNRLLSGDTRRVAYQRLIELAPDDETRIGYVLLFIERENDAVGWQGVKLLNEEPALSPSVIARLRIVVSDALVAGRANALALAVLGHHGDEAILPELRGSSEQFATDTENRRLIDNAVWQIINQHPPRRLLDFLQEGSVEASPAWVVERAKQLELPESELREAVLAFYSRCPKEKLRSFRVAGLDTVVVNNGILNKSQIPPR